MKLAFSGKARYPDYSLGYELYKKRVKDPVDEELYSKIVRGYCKGLADRLVKEGVADLPNVGTIAAAILTRKPQYRGKKFIGYGGMDWEKKEFDGKLKTFGIVFLPARGKNENLRSFGFVANRALFKRMKSGYMEGECSWTPLTFNDDMI